jgi:glycosyltransferase involved in cell wall biosynthesis
MKVVYALTKYHQRSQTFVDLEIGELRRQGVTVHVVSVERGHDERDGTTYLDTAPAAPAAHLRTLAKHPLRYATFLARVAAFRKEMGSAPELVPWWRLPAVAERLDADVVHSHFGWSGATTAALLGALLGVPWSMTLHAKDIFVKTRNLRRKARSADLVVTVCEYNKRGIPRRDVEVLTCGVVPPPPGRVTPDVDVVTVARLIPKKGVDTLLRALPGGVTCEVVGDGPELDALKALAGPNVTFRGALGHDEALDRIAHAKVFALPCRIAPDGDRDAMPTVIIEAMMRGVPVVSTTVAGIPEMVDGTVGRLVPPDDPEALRAALREVLADDGTLGATAAVRARERFALDRQAGRLRALLEAL